MRLQPSSIERLNRRRHRQSLTIPLILDEAVDIGEKRSLEVWLRELLHERPQSSLLHGWHELVVRTALPKQGVHPPVGGAGFEMFIEAESFAGCAEKGQASIQRFPGNHGPIPNQSAILILFRKISRLFDSFITLGRRKMRGCLSANPSAHADTSIG
jgi:hypothetical protein